MIAMPSMRPRILATCAAFATLSAGQALAADAITARLAAPVPERVKFIAGGAMFICEGDICLALTPTSRTFGVSTCKAVTEKVGVVSAFSGRTALDDAKLAACNEKALARVADR